MNWHLEFGFIEDLHLQNHRLPSDPQPVSPIQQIHYFNGRFAMQCALQVVRLAWMDRQPDGYPNIPEGLTGSITHSKKFVAIIIVAREQDHNGVGRDCEEWIKSEVTLVIWLCILISNEFAFKEHLPLVFSVKESIYKSYSGKFGFFDFNEIEIKAISIKENSFRYRFVNQYILGQGYFFMGEYQGLTVITMEVI